jgi:hypothetical protein
MEQYEIRVLDERGTQRVHACAQISDHAAVRRALALTENRLSFEVWRSGLCVYVRPEGRRSGSI